MPVLYTLTFGTKHSLVRAFDFEAQLVFDTLQLDRSVRVVLGIDVLVVSIMMRLDVLIMIQQVPLLDDIETEPNAPRILDYELVDTPCTKPRAM